ncbi:hypothetical protein RRG08_020558 [Elysia crispata]|uniref:Uncharacterized protein n=1 Tax=Elysia crispata TaxID=231223 RepID=A0AAE1A752_9GAST|nr:hypothetical protein RRG08_020558 [Elysia crispata]
MVTSQVIKGRRQILMGQPNDTVTKGYQLKAGRGSLGLATGGHFLLVWVESQKFQTRERWMDDSRPGLPDQPLPVRNEEELIQTYRTCIGHTHDFYRSYTRHTQDLHKTCFTNKQTITSFGQGTNEAAIRTGVTPLVVAKERKFEVKELTQKSVGVIFSAARSRGELVSGHTTSIRILRTPVGQSNGLVLNPNPWLCELDESLSSRDQPTSSGVWPEQDPYAVRARGDVWGAWWSIWTWLTDRARDLGKDKGSH